MVYTVSRASSTSTMGSQGSTKLPSAITNTMSTASSMANVTTNDITVDTIEDLAPEVDLLDQPGVAQQA